jgi:hypothetical protein
MTTQTAPGAAARVAAWCKAEALYAECEAAAAAADSARRTEPGSARAAETAAGADAAYDRYTAAWDAADELDSEIWHEPELEL